MSSAFQSTLYSNSFNLDNSQQAYGVFFYHYFIYEEYEAQRSEVAKSKSHSKVMEEALWLQRHYCDVIAYFYIDI